MIALIQGKVASYTADAVVVENNGIGWLISYPHVDRVHLNEEIRVYTYMHVSENDIGLFGFESQKEKDLFLRLISVKGLGPKTAMAMLAKADADRIIRSIEDGDASFLKSMPGIGAKSASQIILDLKGKLVTTEDSKVQMTSELSDAAEALKNLGYKPAEVNSAVKQLSKETGLTSEQYLKKGLQILMKAKLGG